MESNGNGSAALQTRLNDPHIAASLNRLLDRIDTLEETVNRLADMTTQAPAFTAMVGDVIDDTYNRASANGVDLEERLQTALVIGEKLTAPEMGPKLDNLLTMLNDAPGLGAMVGDMVDETYRRAAANGVDLEARLQTLLAIGEKLTAPEMGPKLDNLLAMLDEAPGFAAMVGDMVDETYRQAADSGVDLEERLTAGLRLANKLTEPQMVASLEQVLAMADTAPGFVAMLGDMADEAYRNAAASGVDLEQLMSSGVGAAGKLSVLLDSGLLDDGAIRVIGAAGKSLAAASEEEIEPVGLFGLLGAMRDPNTQRALGFLMNVAKKLGRELS